MSFRLKVFIGIDLVSELVVLTANITLSILIRFVLRMSLLGWILVFDGSILLLLKQLYL